VSSAAAALLGGGGGGRATVEAALAAAAHASIAAAAGRAADRAGFEAPVLGRVRAYAATVPPALIAVALSRDMHAAAAPSTAPPPKPRQLPAWWAPLLDAFAHDAVADARTRSLFDVVVDYPASQPALNDVAACLAHGGAGVLGGGGSSSMSPASTTSRRVAAAAARHPGAPLRRRLAASLGAATRARLRSRVPQNYTTSVITGMGVGG
jgi:hypothetical protein